MDHIAYRAGIASSKILFAFAGVGKTRDEMREALKAEILAFNVESVSELCALDGVAQAMGVRAPAMPGSSSRVSSTARRPPARRSSSWTPP
jgi:diaminopimelate decarboxylase